MSRLLELGVVFWLFTPIRMTDRHEVMADSVAGTRSILITQIRSCEPGDSLN
jgi:hypothetical protein